MNNTVTNEEARFLELQMMTLDYARRGDDQALLQMLDAGMPVNLCDENGQSLLMLASYHGHASTSKLLLENGANVDQRNDRGQTPLAGVAFKGHVETAKVLIEHGADVNAVHGMGMTPLTYANMFGRREMVYYLRTKGGKFKMRDKVASIPSYFYSWVNKKS